MEIDLSKINEIDMECDVADDDDSFFIAPQNPSSAAQNSEEDTYVDDRPLKSKTGIIISFDDDDTPTRPMKTIRVTDLDEMPQISPASAYDPSQYSEVNEIDMECNSCEDDDDEILGYRTEPLKSNKIDFGDDDDNLELIDEDVIEASKQQAKKFIDQGTVEDDFYNKLKKKHASTNKKGAYNTHFHFAGNPKLEMDDFNDMMTPTGPIPNMVTATAQAAETASISEARNAPSYRDLFENLLKITGFELADCGNGKCKLKDLYTKDNEKVCDTITEVQSFLTPYVEDCFIIPLQVETGQNIKDCKGWVKWYTPEMQSKYPQCESDVQYCDIFGNHLAECKLF